MARIHIDVTKAELMAQGLSEKLATFVLEHPRDGVFWYWCGENSSRWPANVPWPYATPDDVTDIYPLWNRDAEQCVLWIKNGERQFVWRYHEHPEPELIARTEQGLLADLFTTLYEDQEIEVDALRGAADLVGFSQLDRVIAFCQTSGTSSDYSERHRRLIDQIDRGSV
jgi:hypothetical protein